ncbi:universal stress protein [Flavobacteriaceae bacterium TP-CH-4]|uniref:Universal stress protein n=1 Tax=Pelagihabitans pacificus TaxID=2696054 RepID=A0A967AUQ1_9FLAO|nr:universal stress protein [Pelagihabitans pacificus]NHF59720.1 universal stress protein [Pelagihabitans pacificus]
MKRILLPTDFSDNSFEAIRYALLVFKEVECTFYLLNTYTPPVYSPEYVLFSPGQIGLGDIFRENSISQLEKLKSRLEKQYPNQKHKIVIRSALNSLLNEILETTESQNIDLVIMGTKGATGAKEILFGTNTVHVIKKSKCPVVAIPPHFEYVPPKEILFPTDYEVSYEKKKLTLLLEIVEHHKSTVHAMHVSTGYGLSDEQKKNRKQLEQLLGGKGLFYEVPNNEIIAAVNDFQAKANVNLLVMIQNKHTFLERLFIEPIIKKIGFHVNVPFMVVPQV